MQISSSQKVLELFHTAYKTSPAYHHFIDTHKLNPSEIVTPADITKIPIMDKHNYINKYPLEDRLYNGKKVSDFYMISASSGSSGEPTFWVRDANIDSKLGLKKEEMFEQSFGLKNKTTLCIVNLALGAWTGGMLTAKLSWMVAQNQKMTVVTPGVNKEVTASMIKKLHQFYDQIIILGYPPFILDLVDFLVAEKMDIKKMNIRIMCTAERFSERWRNYIAEKISPTGDRHAVVGFYACSDSGIIGCESQQSIDILHAANQNPLISKSFFGASDTPSFFDYDPRVKYLEAINSEIVLTADQPIPLIRYNIHDRGGLLNGDQVKKLCREFQIPFVEQKIKDDYVFVYGRSDAVLLTANIYIEDIKYCLEKSKFHNDFSGFFQYGIEETEKLRKRLVVRAFLKKDHALNKAEKVFFEKEFFENLFAVNDDLKVLKGVRIEKFKIELKEESADKFKNTKLKYFL